MGWMEKAGKSPHPPTSVNRPCKGAQLVKTYENTTGVGRLLVRHLRGDSVSLFTDFSKAPRARATKTVAALQGVGTSCLLRRRSTTGHFIHLGRYFGGRNAKNLATY